MAARHWLLLAMAASGPALAAAPAACPPQPMRVVRSAGGVTDYTGAFPGIPELCHLKRATGEGDFYFGVWQSNWPGAGDAFPAMMTVIHGPAGSRASFVTRSVPGLQWNDSFINEGAEPVVVAGRSYQTLKLAHERNGIEGNTYHSIITSWRDIATGLTLKVVEDQISGQSYGPETTWHATAVEKLPAPPH